MVKYFSRMAFSTWLLPSIKVMQLDPAGIGSLLEVIVDYVSGILKLMSDIFIFLELSKGWSTENWELA